MFGVRSNAMKAGEDLAKKIMERKKKEPCGSYASISNLVSSAPKKFTILRHYGKHQASHSKKGHRRASSEISSVSNSSSLTMDSAIIPTEERKRSAVRSNRPPRKVSNACDDGAAKSSNNVDVEDALTA